MNAQNKLTIEQEQEQFARLLKQHDWFYHYSDDHRVWSRGNEESKAIDSFLKRGEPFAAIYETFQKNRKNP